MKLRHTLLISTALSTVLGMVSVGVAVAADYDWTGFYVGAGVGAARTSTGGTLDWDDPLNEINDAFAPPIIGHTGTPIFDDGVLDDFPGALEGYGLELNAGFNTEVDNFLFGIEADLLTGPIKSESTYTESGSLSYSTSTSTSVFDSFQTSSNTTSTSYSYETTQSLSYATYTFQTTTVVNASQTLESSTTATTTTVTQTLTSANVTTTTTFVSSSSTMVTDTTSTITSTTVSTVTYNTSTFSGMSTLPTTAYGTWASTITGRAQIDWLSTIKGRVGFTADRTLFFATAGLAIGGVSQETQGSMTVTSNGSEDYAWSGTKSETRMGYVVGGGLEQALDDNWILSGGAEYFSLGEVEYDVVSGDGNDVVGKAKQALDGYNVNVGIKYKF